MRRSFVLLLAVLSAATAVLMVIASSSSGSIIAAVGDSSAVTADGAGRISGTVTAQDTGLPLGDTSVTLFALHGGDPKDPSNWLVTRVCYADMGFYHLDGLEPGTYGLRFSSNYLAGPDYATQLWNGRLTQATADIITIVSGSDVVANAELLPGGHVRGVIVNTAGEALAGITVTAQGRDSEGVLNGEGGGGTTAADGTYDIGRLNTGLYNVSACDMRGADAVYAFQIFGGGTDWDKATPVSVTSGHATPVDMTLPRAAFISGTVSTKLSQEEECVYATAYTYEGGKLKSVSGTTLPCSGDGRFKLPLPPGEYIVGFVRTDWDPSGRAPLFYPRTFDPSRAEVITVEEGELVTGCELLVWGDTRPPITQAPTPAVAAVGRKAALRYRVVDSGPHGPKAEVTILVKDRRGKVVRKLRLGWRTVGALHKAMLRCNLPRGTYRFVVTGFDAGGNRPRKIGSNRLVVK
jgi:hypothetical protein